MKHKYVKITSQGIPHNSQWHTVSAINCTFKGIIFASSGKHRIEVVVDNQPMVTFFCERMMTQQIDLNLNLTTSQILVRVDNMDNQPCDHYITVLLEDNWNAFNNFFTEELEKTLVK